jgi:menaquinone-dependent protoporphyrinogen oxidase
MSTFEQEKEVRVLIAYASRHGATRGIAERIGAELRQEGLDATLLPAKQARDVAAYDAFVVGGAAYYFHWMKEAAAFVRRNRAVLAERPVWLFSSGPLGTEPRDAQGRDVRETAEPKEFAELEPAIHPRDQRVFFGALDRDKLGLFERMLTSMPAVRDSGGLPFGDFRDWEEIDAWAASIARELKAATAGAV